MPIEKMPNEIRVRVESPDTFEKDSFRWKHLGQGISAVMGKKKGADAMSIQAYRFDKENWDMGKVKEWVKSHDITPMAEDDICEENMPLDMYPEEDLKDKQKNCTEEIQSVELFSPGKWNGDNYTEQDIDEIIKSYEETKEYIKPYLKLGHDDKQKLVQNDGMPSLGWVKSLRKVGGKLVADFAGIPEKVYSLITKGAYRRVSVELYKDFQDIKKESKKVFPFVLKAVALLGADMPAVKDLNDIVALGYSQSDTRNGDDDVTIKTIDINNKNFKETEMDEKQFKEVQDKLEAVQKELADKTAQFSQVDEEAKLLKSQKDELEKKFAQIEIEKRDADIKSFIGTLESNDQIIPTQKDFISKLLELTYDKKDTVKFSDDKEYSLYDLVKKSFGDLKKLGITETFSTSKKEEKEIDLAEKIEKEFQEALKSGDKRPQSVIFSEIQNKYAKEAPEKFEAPLSIKKVSE